MGSSYLGCISWPIGGTSLLTCFWDWANKWVSSPILIQIKENKLLDWIWLSHQNTVNYISHNQVLINGRTLHNNKTQKFQERNHGIGKVSSQYYKNWKANKSHQ